MHYQASFRKRPLQAEINLIPYIDVMLVLLVIFMMTTPLIRQSIDLNLPKTAPQVLSHVPSHPRIISIDREGRYYLTQGDEQRGKTPIALVSLVARISRLPGVKQAQQPVLVKADQRVRYDAVIQLIAKLKFVGISRIGLVTEPMVTQKMGH